MSCDFVLPYFVSLDLLSTKIVLLSLFSSEIIVWYVVPLNLISLDISNWRLFTPVLKLLWLKPLHFSPVALFKLGWASSPVGIAKVRLAEAGRDSRFSTFRDVLRLASCLGKQWVVDGAEENCSVEALPDVGNLTGRLFPRIPEMVRNRTRILEKECLPETSLALLAVVGLFGITRVKVRALWVADWSPEQGAALVASHAAWIASCWLDLSLTPVRLPRSNLVL